MKGSLQGYALCTIKIKIIRHAVETACVAPRPLPRHRRLSLSFPLRTVTMTCVTTVRCCGTSGRYQLTCHVVSANRDMMLRWWVLVGLLWLATWHCAIVFVWLVCRQWQLGRALSVETRYGGVVTFWWPSLLAHFPSIIVRCCCCCGQQQRLVASFLSRLVSSVCAGVVVCGRMMVAGGGSQWRR